MNAITVIRTGNAPTCGRFPYWTASLYQAKFRKRDNVNTWRPLGQYPTTYHRSYAIAVAEAKQWAEKHGVEFIENLKPGTPVA